MAVKTYDPSAIDVICGGFPITGFADGSMVTVEKNSDAWITKVGSDGEGSRSKSCDRSGKVTIRLMQTSPSNLILSGFFKADDIADAGTFPCIVKDSRAAGETHAAENAWIQKEPSASYEREDGVREWVIASDNIQSFLTGHA